jgi:hypothetical protein
MINVLLINSSHAGYFEHLQPAGPEEDRSSHDLWYLHPLDTTALLAWRSGAVVDGDCGPWLTFLLDGPGCAALVFYSFLFMRWSLAITPANYPLLVCHASNEVVQLVQLGRWANAYTHLHCPRVSVLH